MWISGRLLGLRLKVLKTGLVQAENEIVAIKLNHMRISSMSFGKFEIRVEDTTSVAHCVIHGFIISSRIR